VHIDKKQDGPSYGVTTGVSINWFFLGGRNSWIIKLLGVVIRTLNGRNCKETFVCHEEEQKRDWLKFSESKGDKNVIFKLPVNKIAKNGCLS
jgi:hypothetical protein